MASSSGGRVVVVMLVYYVLGQLSTWPPLPPHAGLVWLPSGLALPALMRAGLSLWPGIAAGAWLLAFTSGVPAGAAILVAIGHTIGPLAAAWIMRRWGTHSALDRRQDLRHYALVGAAGSAMVSATLCTGAAATAQLVDLADISNAWLHHWLSDAAGVLLLGVPLLTLSRNSLRRAFAGWRCVATLLLSVTAGAFWMWGFTSTGTARALSPLMFVPHLLLCWLAARSGMFAASVPTLLLGMAAAWATANGFGPFVQADPAYSVALLWGHVGTLTAVPLLLTAMVSELRANDERWQLALASSNIGVAEWDGRSPGELIVSPRGLAMLGHDAQSFSPSTVAVWKCTHAEDQPRLREELARLRRGQDSGHLDLRMRCGDGSWKWLDVHAIVPERNAAGTPRRIIMTARDMTEQRLAQESYQLAAKLFQHLHEGLLITDAQHRVLDVNPTYSSITGYTREEVLGTVPPLMRPGIEGSAAERQQMTILDALEGDGTWRGEISEQRRNGETCSLQVTISAVKPRGGPVRFYAWSLSDITQALAQRAQLERQAHTDELTGLPNRARLAQLLREAMQASEREDFLLTICYLDLDHFKPVNDTFGHEAGDRLLIELAERLRRSLRHWASGNDQVARLGGDEFVLLLRTATLEEGRQAVERVMRNVSMPYGLGVGAGPVHVTASLGATVYPIDRADADTLLRHADHAMYGAKQAGRNGYLFFDAEHDRRTEEHLEALGRVQEALDAGQFTLHYQPKVDMDRGKVLGMEALLRWEHPEHGLIAPAQFLPLVEHTGLSARLGDWVLQQGIEQLATWQQLGLDMTVSVNISARHLQEPDFAERLAGMLARHASPVGRRLVIEVLETAALADVDYTCELIQECRKLGVRFALDDFGTGYSTFTYLKRLPLDMLKIDRSFVHTMLTDRQDLAIVEGVIGLSQTFGCTVVAEGVESPEQAHLLIEMGCTVGQGNGIAKAMPAENVYRWVRDYRNPFAPAGAENAV
jgi:diguanylate cyclase (GGDEF)-like protein/PAS domain S-box-containing protein